MKLTDDVIKTISDLIRKGYPPRVACAKAKISKRSYYGWHEKGRKLAEQVDEDPNFKIDTLFDQQYLEFYYAVEDAHADNIIALNDELNNTEKSWQKTCWKMERRYREEYGRFGQPLSELKQDNIEDETPPEKPELEDEMGSVRSRLKEKYGLPKV